MWLHLERCFTTLSNASFKIIMLSGLQKRLTALPPTLRCMKTDYASLRSQVRNFSDFYGAAISDAKKQVCKVILSQVLVSCMNQKSESIVHFVWQISAAIIEMSEANKDLLEKYRKEVALRRKYHEQLVELKGTQRTQVPIKEEM